MFCNDTHIDIFVRELSKYFKLKNILTWYKHGGSIGDLKGSYIKNTEFVLFATKDRHLLNGKREGVLLDFQKVNTSDLQHQNQKPVELLEYLIQKSSNPKDTVLDCFMGSGSTGVACANTNRNFIGIELDQEYYKIAEQRINETTKQQKLRTD